MGSLAWLVDTVIRLYIWIVIASAILSWLVAFNVVNPRHRVVQIAGNFLHPPRRPNEPDHRAVADR